MENCLDESWPLSVIACREYWMMNRVPGFLAVVWFGSFTTLFFPLPPESCLSLSRSSCVSPIELTDGRGGGGRGGANQNDGGKALSSINHSILWVGIDDGWGGGGGNVIPLAPSLSAVKYVHGQICNDDVTVYSFSRLFPSCRQKWRPDR